MDVSRADNCQKLTNVAISGPKQDLYNINAYTQFGDNPLIHAFTQGIVRKRKYRLVAGQIIVKN